MAGAGEQEKVAEEGWRGRQTRSRVALQALREITLWNGDVQSTFENRVLDLTSKAGAKNTELNVILDVTLRIMKDGRE